MAKRLAKAHAKSGWSRGLIQKLLRKWAHCIGPCGWASLDGSWLSATKARQEAAAAPANSQ
jgi:hypothetical protein